MKIFPLFACLATIASSLAGAMCAEIGDKAKFKPIEFDALETVVEYHFTPLPPTFPEHAILFLEGVIQSKRWNDTDRAALKQSIAELKKLNEGLPGRDDVEACIERDPEMRDLSQKWSRSDALRQEYARRLYEALAARGRIVDRDQQHRPVWTIIDSLEGKFSGFDQLKSAFLLAFVARSGSGVFEDAYVREWIGIDQARATMVLQRAKEFKITNDQLKRVSETGFENARILEQALFDTKHRQFREPLEPLTAKEVASFEKAMGVSLDTLARLPIKGGVFGDRACFSNYDLETTIYRIRVISDIYAALSF